ncbi:protein kinase [Streptomyces sp. NPDC090083]|uniref:protein kinase domain-containing protein n=1 Tax=Streptomyces sp. NPDC090083 TaxID=3365941 RepID=UPI0038022A6B
MEKLGAADPQRIGAYRLVARLGAGGMGYVYLARSDRGRTVAVKLVREDLAAQEEFRARFRQEVRAARRVGGYWTAPVLDADTEAEVPWVATGYVAGPTLQQVVGRDHGALPERSVRILAAGLAHALKDIHAAGIVHRDLKPSNVLVTIDGPRVIDFGIARALETLAGDGLTRTGSLVGSPGFMAPEQVRGDRITPACDVFCLGSVLAYAATGTLPFGTTGSGVHALMFRIAQEEPNLSGVPEGIADLVRDCLRKDPATRPTLHQILDRTGADDTVSDGRSRDPWLPNTLVAQLGRQAVKLLDTEDPETAERDRLAPAAAPAGPGQVSAGKEGAGEKRAQAVAVDAVAETGPAAASPSGPPATAVDLRKPDTSVGPEKAEKPEKGEKPVTVVDLEKPTAAVVPEEPAAPSRETPAPVPASPEHAPAPSEASPEHAAASDDSSPTPTAPDNHLPTAVADQTGTPGTPSPPAPHPAHGHPQQHPQPTAYDPPPPPTAYGYPEQQPPARQLVGWGGQVPYNPYPHNHEVGLAPTPAYGPVPGGRPQAPPRNGRSTALLVVVALIVALGAGGSVYALMKDGGNSSRTKNGSGGGGATSGAPTTPGPSTEGPSTSPSPSATPAGDGAVPTGYLGTWNASIDNDTGHNTRQLTIRQGKVGDPVLTLVADGPGYHCEFSADLAQEPGGESPLAIGASTVTSGRPLSSCNPGSATEITLLSDGTLQRVNTSTGEKLTYTRSG